MAEPSTKDMFAFLKNLYVFILDSNKRNKNLSYVEGWAINIWQLLIALLRNQHMSYVDGSAVNTSVQETQKTGHMLTAQASTYDVFWLIELYGRKVQSVHGQTDTFLELLVAAKTNCTVIIDR